LSTEQIGSNFGFAVAVTQSQSSDGSVAIGAPSYVNGTNADEFGAVSVHRMTSDGVVTQIGETIVGGFDVRGRIDAGFGTAITFIAQNNNQMVVCNPNDNSLEDEGTSPRGRCFPYMYALVEQGTPNVFEWIPHPDIPTAFNNFIGKEPGDNYGYDVAGECCVNNDQDSVVYASYYIVGAPDGDDGAGYVQVVAYPEFEIYQGFSGRESDRCGDSVAAAGNLVAFGCPGAGENDNGKIRVIDLSTREEFGSGILGGDGEKLGERGTMDFTIQRGDIGIVVATAQGLVKQYFFVGDEWIETGNPLDFGGEVRVSGGNSIGSSSYVAVSAPGFDVSLSSIWEHSIVTESPTKAPTEAPTPPPTKAPVAPGATSIPTAAPSESSASNIKLTGVAVLMASFSFALSLN
jgi:hypothetical protein